MRPGPGLARRGAGLCSGLATERTALEAKYRPHLASDETPINPYRVYAAIMEVTDDLDVFVSRIRAPCATRPAPSGAPATPRSFLGWGNVSTLGFSLAAAAAARWPIPAAPAWPSPATPAWVTCWATGGPGTPRHRRDHRASHNGGFAATARLLGQRPRPYTCQVLAPTWQHVRRRGRHRPARRACGHARRGRARPAPRPGGQRRWPPRLSECLCSQFPVFGAWATG